MTTEEEILSELKQINSKLKKSTNPFRNFLNGTMSALGYLLGTIIVTTILFYLFSQSSYGREIKNLMESYKSLNSQISVPLLGQP